MQLEILFFRISNSVLFYITNYLFIGCQHHNFGCKAFVLN